MHTPNHLQLQLYLLVFSQLLQHFDRQPAYGTQNKLWPLPIVCALSRSLSPPLSLLFASLAVQLYPSPATLVQVESQYCGCSWKILNVFAVLCFSVEAAATICMQFVENRK